MAGKEKDYLNLRLFRLNSKIYNGNSEICSAFDAFKLDGKRIDKVILLGLESHVDDYWNDNVSCTSVLCEPVVIVFNDGTNLAIQMISYDSLRMGVNTVPSSIKHGINHSTLDGENFFSGIKGFKVNGCFCLEQTNKSYSSKGAFSDERSFSFIIWLENRSIALSFSREYGCMFNFSLLDCNSRTPVIIPKKRFLEATNDYSEAIIFGGGNVYGSLNVYAYRNLPQDLDDEGSIIVGYSFGIDSEFYADEIFGYFLRKHFDKTINEEVASYTRDNECFFTVEAFKRIVEEMQKVARELTKDYSFFYEFFNLEEIEVDNEMESITAENSSILIDFIERICFLISETITDTDATYFLTC